MKYQKPTDEMIKYVYKNYKGEMIFLMLLNGVLGIGMSIFVGAAVWKGGFHKEMIVLAVIAMIFLWGLQMEISAARQIKKGNFMVTKVRYRGMKKPLRGSGSILISYEDEEGKTVTKSYVLGGRLRKLEIGEEITVTILNNQTLYLLEEN